MAKNFSVAWLSRSSQQDNSLLLNTPAVEPKYPQNNISLLQHVNKNVKDVTETPSSPTNSCGYTSGSESEVGEDNEAESGLNRRVRTKFTSYQITQLQKTFSKHKYLGANQRKKIAEKLHLSETQVKTWFQNRRMKVKREVQDTRAEYYTSALVSPLVFPSPLQFQHPQSGQFSSTTQYLHYTQRLLPQHSTVHPHIIHPTLLPSCYY